MSGYDLLKRFEHSLAAILPARHNQIYVELKKLVELGFIEQIDYSARNRKLYAITADGTTELKRWLMLELEPADRAFRFEPLLRANFVWALDVNDAVAFLEREKLFFLERQEWLRVQVKTLPTVNKDSSIMSRQQIATVGIQLFGLMASWLDDYAKSLRAVPQERKRKDRK